MTSTPYGPGIYADAHAYLAIVEKLVELLRTFLEGEIRVPSEDLEGIDYESLAARAFGLASESEGARRSLKDFLNLFPTLEQSADDWFDSWDVLPISSRPQAAMADILQNAQALAATDVRWGVEPPMRPADDELISQASDAIRSIRRAKTDEHARRTKATGGSKGVTVELSSVEEQEFGASGALSRSLITIEGVRKKKKNLVEVDGSTVELTAAPFRLFLRLIAALYETADGYAERGIMRSGSGLVAEGYYTAAGMEQATSRLRSAFITAVHPLPGTDFIEVSGSRVRISTHRGYCRVDVSRLSAHDDPEVVALAERIKVRACRA
jgi:hypothetical protein